MSLTTPKLGFTVETKGNATILCIPDRYPLVALCLWFLDCVLIVMAFEHGHGYRRGPNFELPAVVVYGGIIALTILIGLCLTNTVKVTRTTQALLLARSFLGIPRKEQFSSSDVRNIRIYGPLRNNKHSRKFRVLFDYGDETITLAKGMTQPMANLIVENLIV
jgi:hypothetical protein